MLDKIKNLDLDQFMSTKTSFKMNLNPRFGQFRLVTTTILKENNFTLNNTAFQIFNTEGVTLERLAKRMSWQSRLQIPRVIKK